MVISIRRIGLAYGLALLGVCNLDARDFSTWRVGDKADQDVLAPVALDVIDAAATAARRAEAAAKTPVIFRVNSSVTNAMVLKVTEAFTETHSNFIASLQQQYRHTTLGETEVKSTDFAKWVAAFNARNKKFPLTAELAAQWARGESGLTTRTDLIEQLLQTTSRPVRPDTVPAGYELGETLRLIPVRSSRESVSLDKAEQRGAIVSATGVTTVTRLRGLYRRDFSPENQAVARVLATYIHPNAELDTNLTTQARARAVSQVAVVVNHFDPGQVIVRRGQLVDAKIKAALTQLNEVLPPEPASQPEPVAEPAKISKPETQPISLSNPSTKNLWLAGIVTVVAVVVILGCWRLLATRRRPVGLPALPAELAPQISEMLKQAVVQELAVQRRELLQTQQIAAEEVVRLMHRLNELQAPSQERLAAYERRIVELETELTVRTEENRELLKLKIDLLRQQIETERGPRGVNFN